MLSNNYSHRILITGIGKSGSTALYHAILNSLPSETTCLFEPENSKQELPENISPPVLIKSFIPYSNIFDFIEKKILLIRDPRDNLISLFLYRPYNIISRDYPGEKEKAITFLRDYKALIRKKEEFPETVSVKEIMEMIGVDPFKRMQLILDYYEQHIGIFQMQYENIVDQNFTELEEYLGLNISSHYNIPEKFNRVIRSKKYGNWKNWFVPSDVAYFRPLMKPFFDRFGYADDWELAQNPELDAGLGSLYVQRMIEEGEALRSKKKMD